MASTSGRLFSCPAPAPTPCRRQWLRKERPGGARQRRGPVSLAPARGLGSSLAGVLEGAASVLRGSPEDEIEALPKPPKPRRLPPGTAVLLVDHGSRRKQRRDHRMARAAPPRLLPLP